MQKDKVIGIDLGATNIRGAVVGDGNLSEIISRRIHTKGTEEQVLEDVYFVVDKLIDSDIKAIGIGVPSVVDVEKGIVYDVVHIPSWKEVHLKEILEKKYNVQVFVNNDANCFALGELYFGKGRGAKNMIGLTIGTGLGAGVIINKQLYAGPNCGAGEFGCVDYLDNNYEFYCSGSFFNNVYGLDGQQVFTDAQQGDARALQLYAEMGTHLGNAIKLVMYTYDPDLIILGGSVQSAYDYFEKKMWERIKTLVYPKSVAKLKIERSELANSGILGSAGLYFNQL